MYLFISQNKIEAYNGENLKRYIGGKCVKVITNPTDADLKEFGYKPLIDSEMPVEEGYYFVKKYIENTDNITVEWERHEIEPEDLED